MVGKISVLRMKGKYVLITENKLEFICDKNVMSVDVSSRTEENNKDGKYEPSGVVVLCLYILDNQRYTIGWKWRKQHHAMMIYSKNDLIGGNVTHFGSEGMYYSYGNKGNYGMATNSSIGQYSNRLYVKSPVKTELFHVNVVVME